MTTGRLRHTSGLREDQQRKKTLESSILLFEEESDKPGTLEDDYIFIRVSTISRNENVDLNDIALSLSSPLTRKNNESGGVSDSAISENETAKPQLRE